MGIITNRVPDRARTPKLDITYGTQVGRSNNATFIVDGQLFQDTVGDGKLKDSFGDTVRPVNLFEAKINAFKSEGGTYTKTMLSERISPAFAEEFSVSPGFAGTIQSGRAVEAAHYVAQCCEPYPKGPERENVARRMLSSAGRHGLPFPPLGWLGQSARFAVAPQPGGFQHPAAPTQPKISTEMIGGVIDPVASQQENDAARAAGYAVGFQLTGEQRSNRHPWHCYKFSSRVWKMGGQLRLLTRIEKFETSGGRKQQAVMDPDELRNPIYSVPPYSRAADFYMGDFSQSAQLLINDAEIRSTPQNRHVASGEYPNFQQPPLPSHTAMDSNSALNFAQVEAYRNANPRAQFP